MTKEIEVLLQSKKIKIECQLISVFMSQCSLNGSVAKFYLNGYLM